MQIHDSSITAARLVDLVTYRKDGRAVATVMLSTPHDGNLLFRTDHTAGKLKRLRHNSSVEVAACDSHGRRVGPAEKGVARIMPASETAACLELLHRRHGLLGLAFTWYRQLRRITNVFIEVSIDQASVGTCETVAGRDLVRVGGI